MQLYPLNLTVANPQTSFSVEANGFWYEECMASSGDNRILVKPENGADIILRPGQSFRLTEMTRRFNVNSLDPTSVISSRVIIGSGEFSDNNTTIANVSGSVAISGGQIAISGVANVQENLIAINRKHFTKVALTNYAANFFYENVMAPAENVNGALIQSAMVLGNVAAADIALVAHTALPYPFGTGELLFYVPAGTGVGVVVEMKNKLKIPAGMGLYMVSETAAAVNLRAVNITTL